jgi:hypothetical protein
LLFTYDEEFGGEVGPAWLLAQKLTRPDLLIAAGFSYQVITALNGCPLESKAVRVKCVGRSRSPS